MPTAKWDRRNERARAAGFSSYWQMRKAIEQGAYPSLAPHKIKTKRTADNQQVWTGTSFAGFDLKRVRIEMAQVWSNRYARSSLITFDPQKAEKDGDYLNRYMNAFVGSKQLVPHHKRFTPSEALRDYFVDYLQLYDSAEYDSRYGASWPHGGQYVVKH